MILVSWLRGNAPTLNCYLHQRCLSTEAISQIPKLSNNTRELAIVDTDKTEDLHKGWKGLQDKTITEQLGDTMSTVGLTIHK